MMLGVVLIVIGIVFFAKALGFIPGETMSILWPLLLVVLGLTMISHKVLGHSCEGKNCWCGGRINWSQKKK